MSESEEVILVKKSKNDEPAPKSRIRTALVGAAAAIPFAFFLFAFGFMGVFLAAMGGAGASSSNIPIIELMIVIAYMGGLVGVALPFVGLIWGATQYRYSLRNIFVAYVSVSVIFFGLYIMLMFYLFNQESY